MIYWLLSARSSDSEKKKKKTPRGVFLNKIEIEEAKVIIANKNPLTHKSLFNLYCGCKRPDDFKKLDLYEEYLHNVHPSKLKLNEKRLKMIKMYAIKLEKEKEKEENKMEKI